MKKLVMVVLVAVAALLSQGAQVTWSANNIMSPSDSSAKLTGAMAYLFDVADVTSADMATAIDAGKFASVRDKALSSVASAAAGTVSKAGQVLPESYAAGASPTLYAVIFDSSDTTSGNYIITATKSVALKGTGATVFAFGSQAGATWTKYGSDVPEPTSGLLLLIGGAMLALRRKQK